MTGPSRPLAVVAEREIAERVRSRMFLLSTLLVVLLFVAAVVVPSLADETPTAKVGLTGTTPAALPAVLRDVARVEKATVELRRYPGVAAGEAALRDGRAGVLIVDGRRLVWKSEPDARLATAVTAAVQRVLAAQRAAALGLTAADAARLLAPPPVPARLLEAADADREARQAVALLVSGLLLAVMVWYGNAVAEGVTQEKGGRVVEVLLSRVRARDLLAGKVLGIGAVGLAQLLAGLAAALAANLAFDTLDVPEAVPATLAAAVVWFAIGYALWSTAYAAVGALVSRVEDLQAAISPLNWMLILSFWVAFALTDSPDGLAARVASFVPITAPFAMPVRVALGDVSAWEIALSAGIALATTVALIRLAARVYAGGLLRTGARPGPRDVWRAVRGG